MNAMNDKKVTFNKNIFITLCFSTIMSLQCSEYYDATKNALQRRIEVNNKLYGPITFASQIPDLTLREAVLDKDLTQVQKLLETYDKSYMSYKIIDDAQASLDETSYSSSTKLSKRKIFSGISLLGISIASGAAEYAGIFGPYPAWASGIGEKKDRGLLILAVIGSALSGFYMLGDGISSKSYESAVYHEFCKKNPDDQQRIDAIDRAQKIKKLLESYQPQQH